MKNLSLNLAPDSAGPSPQNHDLQAVHLRAEPFYPPSVSRRQTLTLSIPPLPIQPDKSVPKLKRSFTDSQGTLGLSSANKSQTHVQTTHHLEHLRGQTFQSSPEDKAFPNNAPSAHMLALKSPFSRMDSLSSHLNGIGLDDNRTQVSNIDQLLKANNSYLFPEELQELNLLDAYTNGPANVLNDCIFLYSDPINSVRPIDINDYDLVVNVARECDDMSLYYTLSPERQYIYVPWTHTSTILVELPTIIETMSRFDDSDKEHPKRKILVHCQCGVSRSACVIVAFFMFKFGISVNEAYDLLKQGTRKAELNEQSRRESKNSMEKSGGSSGQTPENTNQGTTHNRYTVPTTDPLTTPHTLRPTGKSSLFNITTKTEGTHSARNPSAYSISPCSLICPNMRLIFELMEFGDSLR